MSNRQAVVGEPLADFLEDWRIHLRARNRSRGTIESYLTVGSAFCGWLAENDLPSEHTAITQGVLEQYLAAMHERVAPATVAKHYRSLQQLFRWLVVDGELDRSPMENMSPPAVPEQPVPVLDMDTLARLLKSCAGNIFENRRDTAIIRLFLDTGMRANVGDALDRGEESSHLGPLDVLAREAGLGARGARLLAALAAKDETLSDTANPHFEVALSAAKAADRLERLEGEAG